MVFFFLIFSNRDNQTNNNQQLKHELNCKKKRNTRKVNKTIKINNMGWGAKLQNCGETSKMHMGLNQKPTRICLQERGVKPKAWVIALNSHLGPTC